MRNQTNLYIFVLIIDPAPPTPVLLTATPLTSSIIDVHWKSQIDHSFLTENYTVCAVDKNGRKIRKSFVTTRSRADTRSERNYGLEVKKLRPFTKYSVYVFASKMSDGKILISPDSNRIDVETKEAGKYFVFLALASCVCSCVMVHRRVIRRVTLGVTRTCKPGTKLAKP